MALEILAEADEFVVPDPVKSVKREILQMKLALGTAGTTLSSREQTPSESGLVLGHCKDLCLERVNALSKYC